MDKSPNRTPSPSGTSTISRGNPFSIDYILSSSAAAAAAAAVAAKNQQQSRDSNSLDQMNLMNQQRARVMAAAAAAAAQSNHQQQPAISQDNKIASQAHPNFLYFMACMLFQQQQQQQQQRQQVAQQQSVAANNQSTNRQPIDLVRNPMDSLSILARLTGDSGGPQQEASGLSKHTRVAPNQTLRHQPYQFPADISYNPSQLMSLHHQLGAPNRQSQMPIALDLLNQRRPSTLIKSNQPMGVRCTLSSNGNCSNSSQHRGANLIGNSTNNFADKLDNLKPAHSYIGLIGMCILSSPDKRMVLNDIYQFILDNYPYYRNRGSGWRNSVRHNLSLNECFQKAGRAANGKGHYWTIHPANMDDFMMGDFRRRRAQRKVRRWNNMDVPSDESEDESMEDATKPPLPEHFKRSLEMHRRLELSYQKSTVSGQARTPVPFGSIVSSPSGGHLSTMALNKAPSDPCSGLFLKQDP